MTATEVHVQPMSNAGRLHLIHRVLEGGVLAAIDTLLDAGYIPDTDYGFFASVGREGIVCLMTADAATAREMAREFA